MVKVAKLFFKHEPMKLWKVTSANVGLKLLVFILERKENVKLHQWCSLQIFISMAFSSIV